MDASYLKTKKIFTFKIKLLKCHINHFVKIRYKLSDNGYNNVTGYSNR